MIRVLSALTTRITPSLCFKSPSSISSTSSFIFKVINQQNANFTSLVPQASSVSSLWTKKMFLKPQETTSEQIRTVIKYSWPRGKRKSVRAVTNRFLRLNWGIWIRTKAGRHRKLWKKSANKRNSLLHHVFCNAKQSRMLDKMVNKFWRKPKNYIDDPYEYYHRRENFLITQRKPWRPEGVDYE